MVAKQRKMKITIWPYCPVSASAGTLKIAIFVLLEIVLCKTESQHIPFIRHYERVFYDHVTIRDHHVIRRSADDLRFQFWAFGRSFTPVLRQDDMHLHQNLVIETSKGIKTHNRPLPYSGYIKEDHSSIKGVLTKGGHFEGKIITQNETYFMERTIHHFQHADEFHTLVYRISDVTFNSSHSSCAHARLKERQRQLTGSHYSNTADVNYETGKMVDTVTSSSDDKTRKYSRELNIEDLENEKVQNKRVKRELDPTKRICELYMQADHKFYEKYGSDVDTVVEKLTQHVQAADEMYRNINFDGNGGADSIGFIIKRMKIWDDPGVEGYKYDGNFDVDYFLDLHSRENYDAFCLSYMFTYQDFSDGVLGLAWVGHPTSAGGICETYKTYKGGESMGLNTGIVTLLNYGSHVPFAVSQVTFAHEIGHNFGSDHDPESDQECTPGETAGNYIMYARATSGKQENNFKLSKCSIEQIYPVLDVKASGADGCFVADTGELCGNMVVESSEECDCGWEDQCTEGCCNPMVDDPDAPGVETPCTRKSSAVCSPSEGICCDASCQYKNDSVPCRPESDCLDEAICTGTSADCPASSHKPNATTCDNSDDLLVCYNGECTGSICLVHGRESCQCSPDSPSNWKDEKLCQVCCMDGHTCKSSYELDDVPDAKSLAGQPCNDYQGYCDVFKICRQVSPEGPLSNLQALLFSGDAINAVKDFLTKHWYIGLIFGFVFIVTIVILRILSRKGIVCKSKHQDLMRDDDERPDDENDSANTVFATDLSRQNGRSSFHNSSSNSASKEDTLSPAMFGGTHISAFARHGMQSDAIRQYISKQGTQSKEMPGLYTRDILNRAIRESTSRQNAQGKATPAQFAREEDIKREACQRLSSMYTTKTEKMPSTASKLRQSNDTPSHDRIQFKALQQFQNIPQSNERKETNSDKQQPLGKVKTIVVYTQRKGQANAPVSRSSEMQRPR